ncbi:MAG: hypothetical protein BRC59_11335 [Cyanobacteria bacterium SW_4_48_29]|nr:MAG: hypothetical protein BRC59_11335 [Cyanobacteria bacterium SW_4_48_29]
MAKLTEKLVTSSAVPIVLSPTGVPTETQTISIASKMYDYGGWTGKRLATYLAQRTGIELSSSSVRRILRQKNMLISKKIKYRIKAKHNINRN